MNWRPFDRPLQDLTESDLKALVDGEAHEGLHLECKSVWGSHQAARSVASFANSDGGGTLIVGVEAKSLIPTALSPDSMSATQLTEAAVIALRAGIAPIPNFRVKGIDASNGGSYVVVEVPSGLEPPYIHIRSGQVLTRNPIGSEPIQIHDRETLDRLYRQGRRGREWAQKEAADAMVNCGGGFGALIVVVPTVSGGLGLESVLFRQSTWNALMQLAEKTFLYGPGKLTNQSIDGSGYTFLAEGHFGGKTQLLVLTSGVVRLRVIWDNLGSGEQAIPELMASRFEQYVELFEETFGHRGHVVVAVCSRWKVGDGGEQELQVVIPAVPVSEIAGKTFAARVQRQMQRSLGYFKMEPEH